MANASNVPVKNESSLEVVKDHDSDLVLLLEKESVSGLRVALTHKESPARAGFVTWLRKELSSETKKVTEGYASALVPAAARIYANACLTQTHFAALETLRMKLNVITKRANTFN